MNEYRRIYVPLSKEEFIALQETAQSSYRHPRDQARHILRTALLGKVTEMTTTQPQPEPAATVIAQ